MPSDRSRRRLPASSGFPSTDARMPPPGICEKSSAAGIAAPSAFACSTTARARGCSLSDSAAAARESSSRSSTPSAGATAFTAGLPSVIVPVLSSTTVSTPCAVSSASPDFIRMPFCAPLPVPTIIAVGVARPSAQGQDMTRTAMPQLKANSNVAPTSSQTTVATTATAITAGTNTPLTLSASLAMGAFEPDASSTRRTICERVVSSPTFVARILKKPDRFIVAPTTSPPTDLSFGTLSPVIADSSIDAPPSVITPSVGTASPGRTTMMSPTRTSSTGILCSTPFRSTDALLGARSMSFEMASEVRPFARASKNLPSVISVSIMPADSKYSSCMKTSTVARSPSPSAYAMRYIE